MWVKQPLKTVAETILYEFLNLSLLSLWQKILTTPYEVKNNILG